MSLNRYSARRDANEAQIIKDLRMIGAIVEQLDKPDLIVRFAGRIYLMEVTNPDNKYRKRDEKQLEFLERFMIPQVRTSDEAFRIIGAL
jgi:hypothetical protein